MFLSEALCLNGPSTSFSHWEGIKWKTDYNSRSWPVLFFTDVSLCHECSVLVLSTKVSPRKNRACGHAWFAGLSLRTHSTCIISPLICQVIKNYLTQINSLIQTNIVVGETFANIVIAEFTSPLSFIISYRREKAGTKNVNKMLKF